MERYGQEEGRKRYENFIQSIKEARKRKGACNTLDSFIEKYGNEEGRRK